MIRLFMPPTIHVAGAVTDTDETYGAYVAAENNTFNNINSNCTSNRNNKKNIKNKIIIISSIDTWSHFP